MSKTIVVEVWNVNPKEYWGYSIEMRVVLSEHPRFTPGYRWDWGFQQIVLEEGWATVLVPMQGECPIPKVNLKAEG